MIIEGRNAVTEALRGDVTIEKIMIAEDANASLGKLIAMCKDKKIKLTAVGRDVLDKLSNAKNHQGVIAVVTDFKYSSVGELMPQDGKNKLLIILDGISDPHNLGAIIRTADAVGADGIIISKHRCCGVTDTAVKVSSGASAHVKVAKVNNINDVIRELKDNNVWVFCTDSEGGSVYDADLRGDVAIVIGSEGEGVHALTKKLCDGTLSLPQLGKINSLNASVAAGAVLYECVRQRLKG